jgi:hypothetical protein
MNDEAGGETRMVRAETAGVRLDAPVVGEHIVASPLGWSVARRMAWAVAACAGLWLAVLWALS